MSTINTTVETVLKQEITRDVFVASLVDVLTAKDTLKAFDGKYGSVSMACWLYDNYLVSTPGQLEIINKGFVFSKGKANKKAFL